MSTFDRAHYVGAHVLAPQDAHWRALKDSYAALPADPYVVDAATCRLRRFGRYEYRAADESVRPLEHAPFWQSREDNPLYGGIRRDFPPLEGTTRSNPLLLRLIQFHVRQCGQLYPHLRDWLIYVHQIRILAEGARHVLPAPEGLHRDGHHVVAQVLVARENVRGARSVVCGADRVPCFQAVLRDELDTLLVDDRRLWHDVTPLQTIDASRPAYRDMLLIDFNPAP